MTDQSMTTIVEFQIRPENTTMEGWLDDWNLRADDAAGGEPETSAYAAAVNLEDETGVLVYERYDRGDASLKTHMDRPAHGALMAAMGEKKSTKRVVMSARFEDIPGYGWWRRDRPDVVNAEDVVLVLLGLRFTDEAMRTKFIELSASHAAYCWENEPDTLIYSGGIALDDGDRDLDIKRGDLIFVMGCTDMAAVEKHRDDPNHLALGAKFAEKGVVLEPTFHRTYGTAGSGFLWRQ